MVITVVITAPSNLDEMRVEETIITALRDSTLGYEFDEITVDIAND